jgi:hypothetical protein
MLPSARTGVNCGCFPRRNVKKLRKSSCWGEWVWYGVNVDYEYQKIGTPQQRYPQPFTPQQGPKVRNETILQGTQ